MVNQEEESNVDGSSFCNDNSDDLDDNTYKKVGTTKKKNVIKNC